MKKTRSYLLPFLLFFAPFQWAHAQCELDITDLVIEAHPCDADGQFLVDIDFNYSGTTDSFSVIGNGNDYGVFAYSNLYITLGPFDGNGTSTYEFIFTDTETSCAAFGAIGPVNCGTSTCEISNISMDNLNCNADGTYNFVLDFDFQGINNDFFDVYANGNFFGYYSFANVPLGIQNFPSSGNANDWIQVCQNDNPNCCDILEYPSPNCPTTNCEIWDLVAEAHPCTPNEIFFVDLDFNHENTSDSFSVVGNGNNYGTFAYSDLFITLGPFPGNGSVLEFVVTDQQNADCAAEVILESPNCGGTDCQINELVTDFIACNPNGTYNMAVNFNYQNVTNDFFEVWVNGAYSGLYSFANLPVVVEGITPSGNANDVIQVCQNDNPNCCATVEYDAPNCGNDCNIFDMYAEAFDCDVDGNFLVEVGFGYTNTSNSFSLVGNGNNYGTFNYADLPITLGPFAGNGQVLEFIAIDEEFMDCAQETILEAPNCGNNCDFNEFIVEAYDCNADGFFLVDLDFNYVNASDSFHIFINGDGPDDYYGTFAYSELYITIGPFEGNGQNMEFFIVDQDNADCWSVFTLEAPNCNNTDCNIFEMYAEAFDCDDNGNFLVEVGFDYTNTSNSFSLVGNGNNYGTFNYADLPITLGPFAGNGQVLEFVAIDEEFQDCAQETILEAPNCNGSDCAINEITVDILGCNPDGTYNLVLNFEVQNSTNEFFDVFTNGAFYDFFNINDLPVIIENFPASGNAFDFIQVCINDNPNCCAGIEFEAPNCGGSCLTFDDLTAGTFYGTPQYEPDDLIFTLSGVPVKIQEYNTEFNGVMVLDNSLPQFMYPNFDGNFLSPFMANLEFNFLQLPGVVIYLEFDFYNGGGGISIGANDAPINSATSLFDLDGTEIAPGVTLTIIPNSNDPLAGKAVIEGFVGLLTIGGNDALNFDNICFEFASLGDVWPGDTDTDNLSSNFDLLNIGLGYGSEGPARVDPSIGWLAQSADDWTLSFQNDVNYKHADANGDGVINANDKFAIEENFGLTHGIVNEYIPPIADSNDPALFVVMPDPANIEPGPFEAEIHLGTSDLSVDGIYGLAFTFEFNDQIFDAASMEIVFESGWFNNNGNDDLLTLQHQEAGTIQAAMTRINQLNIAGSGKIGTITGIIDDLSGYSAIEFGITQVKGIKTSEDLVPFQTPENYVEYDPNSLNNPKVYQIQVYPNPAHDIIFVKNDYELPIEKIRMMNILGQEMMEKVTVNSNITALNVHHLPQGFYFLEIQFNGFTVTEKIEILHP